MFHENYLPVKGKLNNFFFCLLQVLSPRADIGMYTSGRKKKKLKDVDKKETDCIAGVDVKVEEQRDPALIVSFFTPKSPLTLYSIITPFDAFAISCFENIMENGAFALLEQMLHFP